MIVDHKSDRDVAWEFVESVTTDTSVAQRYTADHMLAAFLAGVSHARTPQNKADAARLLGSVGGSVGGRRRAAQLPPDRRSQIARMGGAAAKARLRAKRSDQGSSSEAAP